MKKIIEVYQENEIECDNCNFVSKNDNPYALSEFIAEFINCQCPEFGNNLLTVSDYNDYMNLLKTINWANKYFGWLS